VRGSLGPCFFCIRDLMLTQECILQLKLQVRMTDEARDFGGGKDLRLVRTWQCSRLQVPATVTTARRV
jgi:hypothetical protein